MTEFPDFEDVIDPDDVPVPGSRPRVQHEKKERAKPAPRPWDAHPRKLRVDGREMELFESKALCNALGINYEQLKHWERRGYLPKTNLRLPRKSRGPADVSPQLRNHGGGEIPGRRLYTRAFIEGCVRLAKEHGLDKPGTVPGSTGFPDAARDLYYDTMPGEPA